MSQATSSTAPARMHEVWNWNFEDKFAAFEAAVARSSAAGCVVALDMEFPGFLLEEPRESTRSQRYPILRRNIDQLWPIQVGMTLADEQGRIHGVWTFNLRFDATIHAHTKESLKFLRAAGIDFERHSTEGITALELGSMMASSNLVGHHNCSPTWLTFAGDYDLGYLFKLLTRGRALPERMDIFDQVLSIYCPKRKDLRDVLPHGSLESLGKRFAVRRHGKAHTAGSDALLTMELDIHVRGMVDKLRWNAANEENWESNEWYAHAGHYDEWDTNLWETSSEEWYSGDENWAAQNWSSAEPSMWPDASIAPWQMHGAIGTAEWNLLYAR